MSKENEFMECSTCNAKAGFPVLCIGCLHNRTLIEMLRRSSTPKPHLPEELPIPENVEIFRRKHEGEIILAKAINAIIKYLKARE